MSVSSSRGSPAAAVRQFSISTSRALPPARLSAWTASPCTWLSHVRLSGHDSHDYSQSSVASSLAEGRRSRVSSRWYVRATGVGPPLISFLDLIGHRPWRRGCEGREPSPFAHHGTGIRRAAGGGTSRPDWRLGFRQSSLTRIVRVLRHFDFSRLPSTTALTAGCCSL